VSPLQDPQLLGDLLAEAFLLASRLLLPFLLVSLIGSLVVTTLSARLGIQDPNLAAIARTVGVAAALVFMSATMSGELTAFGARLWKQLPAADWTRIQAGFAPEAVDRGAQAENRNTGESEGA